MANNDPTSTAPVVPDPAIAAATAAAAKAQADAAAAREEMARMQGQLTVLTAAASAPPAATEEMGDITTEPEKVLNKHFDKRAGALLAEQAEIGAATQKDIVSIRRAEDWKEFGPEVEKMVQTNGINKSLLSRPGTYEQLLDMVKSKHIDTIVEKKIAAKTKADADEASRIATATALNSPSGSRGRDDKGEGMAFSDKQKVIMQKLGVNEKEAAKLHESVEDDGVWLRGPAWTTK